MAWHAGLVVSVVLRRDVVNDGATQPDPGGHGTFMAGLIAAHGSTFKGVAPDAKLVSLRVLDASGKGKLHAVLAGFDWLLKNHGAYRIGVLNLSLGAPQATTYHKELMAGVVESAWFAGIAVIAAGRRITGSNTPGADAARSLSVQPARVNMGLRPSLVLVKVLAENGSLAGGLVRWETVSWETVSWEAVTWESVTWESVTWEGVAWESVAWEGLP